MRNWKLGLLSGNNPNKIKNLRATSITLDQIELTWEGLDGLSFEIQRKIDDENWSTIGTTAVNEKTFSDTTFKD
ncbi:fibronectin type III domain-containing protein [Reichenbachiella versicolor]|uniref:fibronectin type III domain-containing protein n=1 Tax=Reichenbachiella versicolor TaxID=1821036 RepID=UPI000D6E206E|nr:fibronectin type III domain-containing protein [Reichenbachiella versicolor]